MILMDAVLWPRHGYSHCCHRSQARQERCALQQQTVRMRP